MVDHPNIKTTTSLVDFVFRCLAYEYLNRTDLVHVLDKPEVSNLGDEDDIPELSSVRITKPTANATPVAQPVKFQKASTSVKADHGMDAMNRAAKDMQSDAPACNTCGHITMRSGTCYKCLNCGNSMGCS
jgi:ribonucleoside-diphosphate reductase alpha chain